MLQPWRGRYGADESGKHQLGEMRIGDVTHRPPIEWMFSPFSLRSIRVIATELHGISWRSKWRISSMRLASIPSLRPSPDRPENHWQDEIATIQRGRDDRRRAVHLPSEPRYRHRIGAWFKTGENAVRLLDPQ